MEIAKALVLAGHGSDNPRCPAAPAGSSHLFPLANRPILFHDLDVLRAAGVREAAILTDGEPGRAIRQAVGDGGDWGISVSYAEWQSSRGIDGALAAAQSFIRDEPVLIKQGGALMRERMQTHMSMFGREQLDALALLFVEPPATSTESPAPGYLLSPRAVSILLDGRAAANPVAGVRAHGGRARVQRVDGCLPCRGDLETLLESNRRLLERLRPAMDGALLDESSVQGVVDIHPSAKIQRSLLRGPLIIGPDAEVTDAYIGPYTSVGADAVIEGTEIEHSIVLPRAELRYVGTRLESSVIGYGARVMRGFGLPAALRISIGEGAEVVLR